MDPLDMSGCRVEALGEARADTTCWRMRTRQRLHPAQDQVAVERAGHGRPSHFGGSGAARRSSSSRGDHRPADDVGVAVDVLGRGVHDRGRAELERPLQASA